MTSPDVLDVATTITAVGALSPLVISLITRPGWSPVARNLVAIGFSLVVGTVTYGAQTGFDFTNWQKVVITVVGVILATALAYKTLWAKVAPALEKATSPTQPEAYPDPAPLPESSPLALPNDTDQPSDDLDPELFDVYGTGDGLDPSYEPEHSA